MRLAHRFVPFAFLMLTVCRASAAEPPRKSAPKTGAPSAASASPVTTTSAEVQRSVEAEAPAVAVPAAASGLGIGVTTLSPTAVGASLSVWKNFDRSSIEIFAGLGSINPVSLGAGGAYRLTVAGDTRTGLHLGLAAAVGYAQSVALMAGPLIGIHIPLGSTPVALSADGGAVVRLVNGQVDASVGALSPVLGVGVRYFLD